ncbi:Uncharacterised protein [Legionella steigerwaltii]|uniref:Uncharacterized protein n=1 Tax=Legionella steigerwaltii TaxID=460 RepID=A0A378LF88_9GAMM|nr:hypothetical protein Lstg_1523 [Legionella steigerwaltii]STY24439.1 Uncharacterised protein [Legionella steigerwaltii]
MSGYNSEIKDEKNEFFLIISTLLTYTYYKASQTFPAHELLMVPCTTLLFLVMIGWLFIYHDNPDWVEQFWLKGA